MAESKKFEGESIMSLLADLSLNGMSVKLTSYGRNAYPMVSFSGEVDTRCFDFLIRRNYGVEEER